MLKSKNTKAPKGLIALFATFLIASLCAILLVFSSSVALAYDPEDPSSVYKAAADSAKKITEVTKALDGVLAKLDQTKKKINNLEKVEIPAAHQAYDVAMRNFTDATEKKERIDRRYQAAVNDKQRIEKQLYNATVGLDSAKLSLASSARETLRGSEDIQAAQMIFSADESDKFVEEVEQNEAIGRTQSRLMSFYSIEKATSMNKEERLKIVDALISQLKKESDEAHEIAKKAADDATEWKNRVDQAEKDLTALRAELAVREKQLAADLAAEKREQERVNADLAAIAAKYHDYDGSGGFFSWPIGNHGITSPFGPRAFGSGFHEGVDFGYAHCNDPIYASAAGFAVRVKAATGNYYGGEGAITLDHGNYQGVNWMTRYLHMENSGIFVAQGQWVNRGQVIGAVGNSGFSTGCHLHFEVRQNGNPIDPMRVL